MRRRWPFALVLLLFAVLPPHAHRGQAQEEPAAPTDAPAAADAKDEATARLNALEQRTTQLMDGAAEFYRPKPTTVVNLVAELTQRGFPRAAKSVLESSDPAPAAYERLVRQLLSLNQLSAAEEVLSAWRRIDDKPTPRVHEAVLWLAQGNAELGLRALPDREAEGLPESLRPMVDLLRPMLMARSRGLPIGVDGNPWLIDFSGDNGSFTPGKASESELAKLRPGVEDALLDLLELLPHQGNLWALLGDVLNARGLPIVALKCYGRAEILNYHHKTLRERRRVLEAHEREQKAKADAAVNAASSAPTAAPPPTVWRRMVSAPVMAATVALGAAFVVLVLLLQIREWASAAWRRASRPASIGVPSTKAPTHSDKQDVS